MECPEGLARDGRRAWERAIATMEEVAIVPDLFARQLERLAQLNDDLALARERWITRKRPMIEKGSTGQYVPHSLLRVQAELSKQILALEEALGLTLLGQRKAGRAVSGGRPQGAASAPDRQYRPRRSADIVPLLPPEVREAFAER